MPDGLYNCSVDPNMWHARAYQITCYASFPILDGHSQEIESVTGEVDIPPTYRDTWNLVCGDLVGVFLVVALVYGIVGTAIRAWTKDNTPELEERVKKLERKKSQK